MKKIKLFVHSLTQIHLDATFKNLDPFCKHNLQTVDHNPYLLYLLIFLFINFFGIYGLGVNFRVYENVFQIFQTNKYVYIHQIFPFKAWTYSDNILAIANFNVLFVYMSFLFNNSVNKKFLTSSAKLTKGMLMSFKKLKLM